MTNQNEVDESCMASAKRLLEKHPNARVVWLNDWPDTPETRALNQGDEPNGHAYVIPPGATPADIALNQFDDKDKISVATLGVFLQHPEWAQDITDEVRSEPIERLI